MSSWCRSGFMLPLRMPHLCVEIAKYRCAFPYAIRGALTHRASHRHIHVLVCSSGGDCCGWRNVGSRLVLVQVSPYSMMCNRQVDEEQNPMYSFKPAFTPQAFRQCLMVIYINFLSENNKQHYPALSRNCTGSDMGLKHQKLQPMNCS